MPEQVSHGLDMDARLKPRDGRGVHMKAFSSGTFAAERGHRNHECGLRARWLPASARLVAFTWRGRSPAK